MGYLVFVSLALALFFGFLIITRIEVNRGKRFFAPLREAFDRFAGRMVFIATHVDFKSFVREEGRRLSAHLAHDIAHLSLVIVRSAERLLTRAVRHLRVSHGIAPASNAAPRAFVKTMKDFKEQLVSARPPYPEAQ
jgi:hypothetical protein